MAEPCSSTGTCIITSSNIARRTDQLITVVSKVSILTSQHRDSGHQGIGGGDTILLACEGGPAGVKGRVKACVHTNAQIALFTLAGRKVAPKPMAGTLQPCSSSRCSYSAGHAMRRCARARRHRTAARAKAEEPNEKPSPGLGLQSVWYGAEAFGNIVGLTKPRKPASKAATQQEV